MHIVGTYVLSVRAGSIQSLYKGYNNLPCVLYTFAVFVFLRDFAGWIEKCKWISRVIGCVGKYTFPLYLIHWFILRLIGDLWGVDTKTILYRLFAPYAIFAVVIAITWCLRKIPGLRKIVP